MSVTEIRPNMQHWQERVDLAAAFRWTARLNMHEAVANHFSLAVDDQGTRFLMNPNQMHFARIRASVMIEVDLDDPTAQEGPDAPDPTAWGLHGWLHHRLLHAHWWHTWLHTRLRWHAFRCIRLLHGHSTWSSHSSVPLCGS